jgi:hypothetical protein
MFDFCHSFCFNERVTEELKYYKKALNDLKSQVLTLHSEIKSISAVVAPLQEALRMEIGTVNALGHALSLATSQNPELIEIPEIKHGLMLFALVQGDGEEIG